MMLSALAFASSPLNNAEPVASAKSEILAADIVEAASTVIFESDLISISPPAVICRPVASFTMSDVLWILSA